MNGTGLWACAAAALAGAGTAGAQIVNGGFETGSLSGWTQYGDTGFTGVSAPSAHSGSYGAFFGPVTGPGGIAQTVAAPAGARLTLSFWLANDGGTPNSLTVSLAGQTLLSLTNAPSSPYTAYTYTVTAPSPNPVLEFGFYHAPAYWRLDDVSVSATPAPGAAAALGGAALIGLGRRRRR